MLQSCDEIHMMKHFWERSEECKEGVVVLNFAEGDCGLAISFAVHISMALLFWNFGSRGRHFWSSFFFFFLAGQKSNIKNGATFVPYLGMYGKLIII